MRHKNKNNWKFLRQEEGDFEETVARQSRRYPNKCDNMEDFKKTNRGRNPENHSIWRERDNRSYRHNFRDTCYDGPEMTDGGIAETSPFTQVLQVRNSKTKTFIKCPPVIASCKIPRSYWEDKPMLVMKIIKRIRCQQYKDTPQNSWPLSSSSTEKEIPVGSGLASEANRVQDRHQPEDRETNAADEVEATKMWASQVNLREEDSSETAETNQTPAKEKEENNICRTKVQLLQTEQKAADEQRKEKDVKAHEDSGSCDQMEDKNQEVIIKSSISEMERCSQELQEEEEEYTNIIHQPGEEINTLKVKKQNFESGVQQLMEDKQQLSRNDDSSKEKVHQLDEVNTKTRSFKISVIQLEDKKREETEQTQSSLPKHKDLLHQVENITEKEEQMQVQLPQLLQEHSHMEDISGQDKKWKKWFSLFFRKASKMGKETKVEMEAEAHMTGETLEKKRSKWFPWFFFSKALKMEKEAKAEEVETKRRNCFIKMFQRTYSSMKKKTCVTF